MILTSSCHEATQKSQSWINIPGPKLPGWITEIVSHVLQTKMWQNWVRNTESRRKSNLACMTNMSRTVFY